MGIRALIQELIMFVERLTSLERGLLVIWHVFLLILINGLRRVHKAVSASVRPQAVVHKTGRTPLQVVWYSFKVFADSGRRLCLGSCVFG
jgi:hypothetical protein